MELAEPEWTALVAHASIHPDAAHVIDAARDIDATRGIDVARGIGARAQVTESGILFRYVLRAEFSRVRIPPPKSAERADGLWQHTCFEAFIKAPAAASYYEFNFSPSRQWAVYRFNAYREGMSSVDLGASPAISVRRFDDRLELDASLRVDELIALQGASHLRVALSAVIEGESGRLSYWALRHAPGKADFHHPDGFALELAL
jgi:hypothetical protein